jgi:hypothetical protein
MRIFGLKLRHLATLDWDRFWAIFSQAHLVALLASHKSARTRMQRSYFCRVARWLDFQTKNRNFSLPL